MGVIRDEQPDWGEPRLLSEVERRLEEMKCKRIAPALFRAAILWLDDVVPASGVRAKLGGG